MSQQPHFVASASPADITAGLEPGCYLAQVRAEYGAVNAILYATAAVAPADPYDWFQAVAVLHGPSETFIFTVSDSAPPTWVMVDPGIGRLLGVRRAPIAIARTGT